MPLKNDIALIKYLNVHMTQMISFGHCCFVNTGTNKHTDRIMSILCLCHLHLADDFIYSERNFNKEVQKDTGMRLAVMRISIPEELEHVEVTDNICKSIGERVCVCVFGEQMAEELWNVCLIHTAVDLLECRQQL